MLPRLAIPSAWLLALFASACLPLGAATRSIPLAVPAEGRTGFVFVPAATAGIRFTNTLSPQLVGRNQNFANGSGVAVGDVDGDGRPDLYFPAIDGTNRLYRNLGAWKFEDITGSAGVGCPNWASTGALLEDIDGDGDLDLLVATLGGGVHCFLNDGKAHFADVTAASGLASKAGSTSLAMGDVDGDGTLDLYVANYGAQAILRSGGRAEVKQVDGKWVVVGPYADRLRIVNNQLEEVGEPGVLYLGDGHGRFRAVPWNSANFVDERGQPKPPPPDYGLSVQIRDADGDGFPDIYACNDFQTPDRLWLNDGRGRFREASRLAIRKHAFSSMGVDFADIDRDGHLDFFTAEMSPRSHARRLRSLTGPRYQPNPPGHPEYRPEVVRNTLYHANGDGTWGEMAEYAGVAASDWSWQPVFLDVDLDGYEDLLVVSGALYDLQDRDTLDRIRSAPGGSRNLGGTNVLLYPPFPSPVSAFRNRGDLAFDDVHVAWGFVHTNVYQGVALADLDGDGDLDMVCSALDGPPALYRNTSAAPRIAVRARGTAPNTRGINARIRVTGGPVAQSQELVSGGRYLSGDEPLRVFAAVPGRPHTVEVSWRSGRRSTLTNAVANTLYEVDEADAVVPPPPAPVPPPRPLFGDQTTALDLSHAETLFDDFTRQPLLHRQYSALGPAVAWADLDGDGRDELVLAASRGGRPAARRFLADGRIEAIACDWTAPDDMAGFAAWTTADGRPALLAAVGNYETAPEGFSAVVQVTMSADRTRLEVTPFLEVPATTATLGPLAVADYDGDGQLDLFVGGRLMPGAYPRAVDSRLFRREGGHLVPDAKASPLLAGVGMVAGAVWTDLEGDGFPELALACEWGPVRLLRNHGSRLEAWDPPVVLPDGARTPLSSLTGWWSGITAGDFDGDGRMDLAVGNWGLNSGYQASAQRPLRLHHGNLAGAGVVDLVESYYPSDLDTEMPRRSRGALGHALPALNERFPTHAAFGEATLQAVLAAIPARPEVVSATTLTSMVFLNRGDSLVAVVLPREAQLAPVQGLSVADVDGDGNEDLLLAQNWFAMRIEWPRTDAGRGVVLLGDGKGGFRAMGGGESGVVVHGEQRGCAVGDYDGDGRPDWVDTQNGTATRLFHNLRGKPGVRARVAGTAGNPAGIGAVLRLRRGDRLGPAREVHSGSGHGSVDSATQVLGGGDDGEIVLRAPKGMTAVKVPAGK